MRFSGVLFSFALTFSLAQAGVYQVSPESIKSSATPLRTGRVTGTVLPIWNSPAIYMSLQRGLNEQGFRLFRFPNGSLSNEYHWNGAGTYDSVGIWHPASDSLLPGFLANTRYRGTTKNNYGAIHYSNLTDGSDSTFWWSDPLGGVKPWVALNITPAQVLDSVQITWGAIWPDSVEVGQTTTSGWNPYIKTDARFTSLAKAAITSDVTTLTLGTDAIGFLTVRPMGLGANGVQIAEIRAWSKGILVTSNWPDQAKQTRAWATSAHPGNIRSKDWGGTGTPNWTFTHFMDYLKGIPGSEAMICVNYGTGTPEEAAAWVSYANIDKKMGIKLWQVGNEMDGDWEEGGPITAHQYAKKYLAYVKAMKAVDPSILVMGPTLSTMEFSTSGSGDLDGQPWTNEFLRLIGEAEIADGMRYLDGFDFHSYPYWTETTPNPTAMLAAMRTMGTHLDTLSAMMSRHLQDPETRLVSLSEFNASVQAMNLTMRPENATGMALMLAQLVHQFGGQSMSIAWESYGASGGNSDGSAGGTFGNLALFVPPRSDAASSMDVAPNAPYWGNWMISKVWAIDSAKPMMTTVTGGNALEIHALTDGTDTSYLFQNMTAVACTAHVSQPSASGWIYSFSSQQYTWNGTTSNAFASPNSGPSSMPIPNGWNGTVVISPFGMVVARTNASTSITAADHIVQMAVNRKSLEFGDTLTLSGTVIRTPGAPAPSAPFGDTTLNLSAVDGAWDGPQEAFITHIAAEELGEGLKWLKLGDRDSIQIRITGKIRPTAWIDQFEDEKANSDQPSKAWWNSYAAGGAPSTLKITYPERPSGGRNFLAMAALTQPADLGYTVYGEATLKLDSALVVNSAGIKFDFASWHSGPGDFSLLVQSDTVKNYDEYLVSLPKTDSVWTTLRLKWSEFQQAGWGGISTGPLLARQVNALSFRANGEGSATFRLDNLVLLSSTGDSVARIGQSRMAKAKGLISAKGNQWAFDLPAGAVVRFYGLNGRLSGKLVAREKGVVFYRPKHFGITYAEVEIAGKRQIKMLPLLP